MKNLIFIDNDNMLSAKDDVDCVKQVLSHIALLQCDYIETIKIIPDFSKLKEDKIYDLLFSGENCICSWSMYTSTHMGSLFQMINLLKAAGRNSIKNITYIDGSGQLPKALRAQLPTIEKGVLDILNAIETNHIITFDILNRKCLRLRIELKGKHNDPFRLENVDLSYLCK